MTNDHHRYFDEDAPRGSFFSAREKMLFAAVFNTDRHLTDTMRFFLMPPTHSGYPSVHEVKLADVKEGDTVLAIDIYDGRLATLRFMYVTKTNGDDCYWAVVNDLLNYGYPVVDHIAGLFGKFLATGSDPRLSELGSFREAFEAHAKQQAEIIRGNIVYDAEHDFISRSALAAQLKDAHDMLREANQENAELRESLDAQTQFTADLHREQDKLRSRQATIERTLASLAGRIH